MRLHVLLQYKELDEQSKIRRIVTCIHKIRHLVMCMHS